VARIFISHRPGDAAGYVMALQTALAARYGHEQVRTFQDVARDHPGAPVSQLIDQAIGEADVVLAVIGTNWLSATDEGGRTLADADDRIRRELERALGGSVKVIPIPIGGASLPRTEQLPEPLRPLLARNATSVRETGGRLVLDKLFSDLDSISADVEAQRGAAEEVEQRRLAAEQEEARQVYTPPPAQIERQEFDWEAFQRLAALATLRRPAREGVSARTKTLRNWFALLGMAAGAGAGWYALTRDDVGSAWLAAFVGVLVFNFISRAFADVLSEPKKIRRLLYFALTPALAGLSFYYTYQWWETWWLSFLLGFVFGGILTSALGSVLFPSIHKEETADTRSRWKVKPST
jgi:hypothetical protein